MDNPTRWNITNSAQNIVSALVDPSKQFDSAFRREWSTIFAGFPKHSLTSKSKTDLELNSRLTDYVNKLENRRHVKSCEDRQGLKQDNTYQGENSVPEIFLREDFDLSDAETFTKIISADKNNDIRNRMMFHDERSSFYIDEWDKDKLLSKHNLRDLQQKLTDYLDIIESDLASQISNRSGDFFQVMSSVDSVMDELSSAIKSVTHLRKKCARLNTSLISPNMKCIQLNRKRDNIQSVLDKINEIAYLCRVQPMIQGLLSASDFVGALDLIAKSRVMLHRDLTRVICLQHLESQLNEIERMIGTMVQQEFLTLISSDWDGALNQHTSAASRLSKLFDYFANGYTEIPERGSLPLLSLLQIQAEKFVNQFHEERKKRLESTLDIEQWKVIHVPHDFQRLITLLVDEKVAIHDIFSGENMSQLSLSQNASEAFMSDTFNDQRANGITNTGDNDPVMKSGSSSTELTRTTESRNNRATTLRQLNYVEAAGDTYVIVNSVINLVRTIMDYCKCAHDIRSLSTDLLERLFKILQLYSQKAYHLVFEAEAIQVAGLKSITTRNLIISQRSLKLIKLLIPSLQRHFARLQPENDNRLRRFDEISSTYEERAAKIPERVKTCVANEINLHLKDWEAKPPADSEQFKSVAQYLILLHNNVQDIMAPKELEWLFEQISETFKDVLIRHLRRLKIDADPGPRRWLVTQELTFYRKNLSGLSCFSKIALNFDDIWYKLASTQNEDYGDMQGDKSQPH